MTDTIAQLRQLGFGALLGGGIGGLVYLMFPGLFPDKDQVKLEGIMLVCGIIGAGAHGFVTKLVLGQSGKFTIFYLHLVTLLTVGRILGKKRRQQWIEKLTEQYIFGEYATLPTDYQEDYLRQTLSIMGDSSLPEVVSEEKTLGRHRASNTSRTTDKE